MYLTQIVKIFVDSPWITWIFVLRWSQSGEIRKFREWLHKCEPNYRGGGPEKVHIDTGMAVMEKVSPLFVFSWLALMSQVTSIHIYMWFLYINKFDLHVSPVFIEFVFGIMKPVFLTAFSRTKNVLKIVI